LHELLTLKITCFMRNVITLATVIKSAFYHVPGNRKVIFSSCFIAFLFP